MKGGRGPRRKGGRVEREVLALLKEAGLEAWLEGRELLVLKPDRRPPLAVMPLQALLGLIRAAKGEALASTSPPPPPGAKRAS